VGVFLGGLFGVFCGFWEVCWVGVHSGQMWVFDRGFYCFFGFGFHVGFGCCGCFLAGRVCQVVLLFLGSGFWVCKNSIVYYLCT
jgi:hypothetical protein